MKKLIILLYILVFNFNLSAQQANEDYCYITLYLKADNEEIESAKFYIISRENIKVEFTKIVFTNGGSSFGKSYIANYNKEKDAWTARLPKGMYRFRTQHPGFENLRESLDCEKPMVIIERKLRAEKLPYTYDMGRKYNYIRGGIEFSETIVVHFNSGTPDENKTFLEGFPHEKIQKIKYINAFFLTLNLSSQESLAEILLRETLGDEPLGEGFYFGDAITETIEKLMENPNVSYANPTFVFPKNSIRELSINDFSNVQGLTSDLKNRYPDEPKKLKPEDFKKSAALIKKQLRELEEN